jgi:hypothetical protein
VEDVGYVALEVPGWNLVEGLGYGRFSSVFSCCRESDNNYKNDSSNNKSNNNKNNDNGNNNSKKNINKNNYNDSNNIDKNDDAFFALKIFSGDAIDMAIAEYDILKVFESSNVKNVPIVQAFITEGEFKALIVAPVQSIQTLHLLC